MTPHLSPNHSSMVYLMEGILQLLFRLLINQYFVYGVGLLLFVWIGYFFYDALIVQKNPGLIVNQVCNFSIKHVMLLLFLLFYCYSLFQNQEIIALQKNLSIIFNKMHISHEEIQHLNKIVNGPNGMATQMTLLKEGYYLSPQEIEQTQKELVAQNNAMTQLVDQILLKEATHTAENFIYFLKSSLEKSAEKALCSELIKKNTIIKENVILLFTVLTFFDHHKSDLNQTSHPAENNSWLSFFGSGNTNALSDMEITELDTYIEILYNKEINEGHLHIAQLIQHTWQQVKKIQYPQDVTYEKMLRKKICQQMSSIIDDS
jgi:hypothetical protein